MKFYLSGGMEYKKMLGAQWRDWLTERLEDLRHDAINPVKLENAEDTEDRENGFPLQERLAVLKKEGKLNEVRKIVRDSLFRKDMWAIQLADAIIILYDEAAFGNTQLTIESFVWDVNQQVFSAKKTFTVNQADPPTVPPTGGSSDVINTIIKSAPLVGIAALFLNSARKTKR